MNRPQYVVFPKDKQGFSIDDQYYIGGSGLLVKPVTKKGIEEAQVYLSDAQVCIDTFGRLVAHAYVALL